MEEGGGGGGGEVTTLMSSIKNHMLYRIIYASLSLMSSIFSFLFHPPHGSYHKPSSKTHFYGCHMSNGPTNPYTY